MPRKRLPYSGIYQPVFSGAVAAAFSPSDIAGLVAWYDFSDVSTLYQDSGKLTPVASDGDPIGAVADKSGNGNDALQTTTSAKPTYKTGIQGGLSAALFDGGDSLQSGSMGTLTQPLLLYAIAKLSTGEANNNVTEAITDGIGASNRLILFKRIIADPDDTWAIFAGTALDSLVSSDENSNLFDTVVDGASSDLFLNGSSIASGDAGSQSLTGLTLGARYDEGANYWVGHIMSVLLYDATVSAGDRTAVRSYMNDKWAVY